MFAHLRRTCAGLQARCALCMWQQQMQTVVRTGQWRQAVTNLEATCRPFATRSAPCGGKGCMLSHRRGFSRSAIADSSLETERLKQSKDSWRIISSITNKANALPMLLLVDGTNLACLCGGGRNNIRSVFSEPLADRFAAWLRFLQLYTQAHTVLVAFDNKGSTTTNVRAQLVPSYLRKRYSAAVAAAGGADLNGWAHLGAVVQQLQQQQQQQQGSRQQQQQQQQQRQRPQDLTQQQQQQQHCNYLVANAAYGYEADDVLAAAAQWASQDLQPRPLVVVASSDSDMQQLMDSHTYWLEMMQVSDKQHPCGMQLHSAADFQQRHGFPAHLYADYLALTGKKEASIPGIGVTPRQARMLLKQVGSVESIIDASNQGQLKQFGPALEALFSSSSSNRSDKQQELLVCKSMFQLFAQQQLKQLPQQELLHSRAAAVHNLQQQQQHGLISQSAAAAGSSAVMAAAHPSIAAHMRQSQTYLEQLSLCLQQLGMKHMVGCLTSGGLWCDVMVQVYSSSSSSSSSSDHSQQQWQRQQFDVEPTPSADWLVIQVLSPAELVRGPQMAPVTKSNYNKNNNSSNSPNNSYTTAVHQLATALADRCGCFAQGDSSLGHAKRKLMDSATGSAKRKLSLLKNVGWNVAAVPFFELHSATAAAPGSSSSNLQYVTAVLQEQLGPSWKPPLNEEQQQQRG